MNKIFRAVVWVYFLTFAFTVKAAEVWLKDISVKDLQRVYEQCGYDGVRGYLRLETYEYPSIFLKNIPSDFQKIEDETVRNVLFIKILTPLALKLNESLLEERNIILKIRQRFEKNKELAKDDIDVLEKKAQKYDLFSRLKENERYFYLIDELLRRIDKIPPSIMITAAAIDTNWGMARAVKEGNSLYKMLEWHTDKGLKPIGETEDDSYRLKTYPGLYESMVDFALKVNSHPAFAAMRNLRYEYIGITSVVLGTSLAPYAYGNSALNNYAGLFDYTLAYYELLEIDKSKLADTIIPESVVKEFRRHVTKL